MMTEDIEKIVFDEETLKKRVEELGREISRDYADAGEGVFCVGILKGAAIFFSDLVRQISLPTQFDFMIASSYGDAMESSGTVQILKDLSYDVQGRHVLLIEDIIDSGTTMHYLLDYIRLRKAASVKLCSLLNKPSRRKVDVPIDYCGFDVADDFLVGYGLDYAERYRNLPYVGILKKEVYS